MKKFFFMGMLAWSGILMGSCGSKGSVASVEASTANATAQLEKCCPGGGSIPIPPPVPPPPPRG